MLKNQHGEVIDDQITHVIVELNKWNKSLEELASDLDKLLFIMKFTETATITDVIPKSLSSAEWIEAMIKELDKRNMPQDQLIAIEMALAREGSMLAAEEEKIKEIKKLAKKRLDFERKKAEEKVKKLVEEKKLVEQKLIEEKKLVEQKLTEEKKLAERKLAESAKKLFFLKTIPDKQIALILDLPIEKIQQLKKEFNKQQK